MKLAFYICSNGYGHFHRVLQICNYLKNVEVDIYCEKYQYNRFKDNINSLEFYRDKPKINFIFYKKSNIRWDKVLSSNNFDYDNYINSLDDSVSEIDKYDCVVTDNLVSILKYRPDAWVLGSFLWSDVFNDKFGNNKLSECEDELFYNTKPKIFCNGDVDFGQIINYDNKVDIGWGCKDESSDDFNFNTIVCITPSLNYTDVYTEKFLQLRDKFQNNFDFSFNINHKRNSIFVIRPGLGMITTCVSYKIPIVALWDDDDSSEIKHLANKVNELGIGISLNVNDDLSIPKNFNTYRDSVSKLKLEGYKKFAGILHEYYKW